MVLKFQTNKQILSRTDSNEAVELTQNYLEAEFTTDTDWSGMNLTALFQKGNKIYSVILDEDSSCVVPCEVLTSGAFNVSLLGTDDDVVLTSSKVVIYVNSTIDNSEAVSPSPTTKSLYEQLLEKIHEIEEEGVSPEVIAEAIEEYLEEHPIEAGISEDECNTLISSFFTSHRTELKGDKGDKGDTGDAFTYSDFTPEQLAGLKGADGTNGTNGEDGFSPTISISEISGGYSIVVTDANGSVTFSLMNGTNGTNGTNGNDGYTPVRGTDYWTNSDKTEIINAVLEALPSAEGGAF